MKTWLFCVLCSVLCLLPLSCGPELTAGGIGVGAGLGLSETIKGMQADLERREAALVQRYNDLVAAGAKAEDLEAVKQQLEQTVRLKQGVQTSEHLLGVDWSSPEEAGPAIGLIGTLAWSILSRRRLSTKYVAMKTGQARFTEQDPSAAAKLYGIVGTERRALGL